MPVLSYAERAPRCSLHLVQVSTRLSTTPCVVVVNKYGKSANMERIMKAQAFSDPSRAAMTKSQKALEINPRCAPGCARGSTALWIMCSNVDQASNGVLECPMRSDGSAGPRTRRRW